MTNYHKNKVKRQKNISVYQKSCDIDQQDFLTGLYSIAFVTWLKHCWDLLYFHKNVPQRCFICWNILKIVPTHWIMVVSSPRKLFKAVLTRNKQTNLQPTLNKRGRDESVIMLSLTTSIIEEFLKTVFKTPKIFFQKLVYV